jgi:RimJ/RimL family protein N-acetyltransferase
LDDDGELNRTSGALRGIRSRNLKQPIDQGPALLSGGVSVQDDEHIQIAIRPKPFENRRPVQIGPDDSRPEHLAYEIDGFLDLRLMDVIHRVLFVPRNSRPFTHTALVCGITPGLRRAFREVVAIPYARLMAVVRIEPWEDDDLELLHRANVPEMKQHLGGVEAPEAVARRHQRYLASNGPGPWQMYHIAVDGEDRPVGTIGFWEHEWRGETVYEVGWAVLPEFQGRGIAAAATTAVVEAARGAGHHRYLYAYPSVANAASNAICRKAGFEFQEECDFEYPRGSGTLMRVNAWRFDLKTAQSP